MMVLKAIHAYRKRDYPRCIKLLKKLYRQNPYSPLVYLLFFLVYKQQKKYHQALYWLKQGFFLLPGQKKITQLYAYYAVMFKKNPDEALIPLSQLASENSKDVFTQFILSRYYYKKEDLERAALYAQACYKTSRQRHFRDWHVFLLLRLSQMQDIACLSGSTLARKWSGKIKPKDVFLLNHPYEKIQALKQRQIVFLDANTLRSPLFQYEFFQKFNKILPGTHIFTVCQILKEKGIDIFAEFLKKKGKKKPYFDENFKRITAVILAFLLFILILWRAFW